jgi:hypothetical protein
VDCRKQQTLVGSFSIDDSAVLTPESKCRTAIKPQTTFLLFLPVTPNAVFDEQRSHFGLEELDLFGGDSLVGA